MNSQLTIQHFFHQASFTLTYVVHCTKSQHCAIIDPVLDFDIFSGELDTTSSNQILEYIESNNLSLKWIMETHAHADHLTSANYLQKRLGGQTVIGKNITSVQSTFKTLFNLESFDITGGQFDKLVKEGDKLPLGDFSFNVIETAGHTPDSVTYVIDQNAFIGDTLFMPDSGSARCDFPDGSANMLYQSVQKIYQLGDDVNLYMCHDYQPNNRELQFVCTVKEQKLNNIQISGNISETDYVDKRMSRDAGLKVPRLIYPSLQLNIAAGQLPEAESNGTHYLKTPLCGLEKIS